MVGSAVATAVCEKAQMNEAAVMKRRAYEVKRREHVHRQVRDEHHPEGEAPVGPCGGGHSAGGVRARMTG